MTTRRERLARKLEAREEWAEKADARSAAAFERARKIADQIPLGQPVLVGHHSERHARRDQERIVAGMRRGCEEQALAAHHRSRADGLAAQLDASVYSDDDDAIEALETRIAESEAKRERWKQINREMRKGDGWPARITPPLTEHEKRVVLDYARYSASKGIPSFALTNLGASIRRDRQRIEEIRERRAREQRAEASGGVTIEGDRWVTITFAEKPERDVLTALKAAGFRWAGGCWRGEREKIPACVAEQQAP